MKIDIVTIFPGYFDVVELSLLGKAANKGVIDIEVHDLRDTATDVHRSVDDTPYGGGAGMVMLPEPWGVMLDQLLTPESVLIVPSPAGRVFNQGVAKELSAASHLVFACGRYEGIDQRVVEHYSTTHDVREISIGDYVVNGGGIINVASELNARNSGGAYDPAWVEAKLSRLMETLEEVLDRSAVEKRPTHEIADSIAEARINAARDLKAEQRKAA